MDCSICLEALDCPSFVAQGSSQWADAAMPDNASRFPCGHAFHSSCAVQSLLTSRTCPTCRASVDAAYAASEDSEDSETLNFVVHTHEAQDPTMSRDPLMHRIRSRSQAVQQERRTFRLELREYNRLQDQMRHRRRQALQEALGALRRRHYATCDLAISRLQASLLRVHQRESEAWVEEVGEEPSGNAWQRYAARDASEYIGQPRQRCETMLDRRFWSLR